MAKEARLRCCAAVRLVWLAALFFFGVSGSALAAAEHESASQTNGFEQIAGDALQTNDLMQAEDIVQVNGLAPTDDSEPDNEPAPANGHALAGTDETGSPPQSENRHSGRESRSRRFSRQPSTRYGGSGVAADSSSQTGTNKGPVSLEYSAFKLVAERNIFNPNRFPRRSSDRPPTRDPEYFTLVGLMSYEKGTFAFFSGSSSAYQKALRTAETIAGYKLTAIASNSVKLARETNEVELSVGMQMRRDDEDAWELVKGPAIYAAASPMDNAASNASPAAGSPPTAASSGAESDIIKRMMQRREQE